MRFQFRLAAAIGILAALMAIPGMAQKKELPVCATCHEAAVAGILTTHHGAKVDADAGACQSCHGDASAHLPSAADHHHPLHDSATSEKASAASAIGNATLATRLAAFTPSARPSSPKKARLSTK